MLAQKQKEIAVSEKKKWVSLTGLCNNNCIFCLDGDRTDRFHRNEEEIKKQIDAGIREKATRLVLSGGEPTIHPKILEFIAYGKLAGYKKIQIITNGRMLAYKSFADALQNAGLNEVTFSIHGHTKKLHESMTRVRGSFGQIISGIKNAGRKGFIVNSDTVITKLNYKYLPEIISFLHSLGINEVNLMSIVPFGNAWKNRGTVIYKFGDAAPFVHRVIEYCKNNNMVLWLSRFPAEYLEGYEEYIESCKKLLEEVLTRNENFFKQTPSCRGDRCAYCGIKTACKNLVDGSYTKQNPPCLSFPETNAGRKTATRGGKSFKDFTAEVCMNARVKRLACSECVFNSSCEGVLIEQARKDGFKHIKPILK